MNQAFILAQSSAGLTLLELPTLKNHNVYTSQKLTGIFKDQAKSLTGTELIGITNQPVFVQLYDDQKSMELLRVKSVDGNGIVEKMKKMSFSQTMSTIAGPKKESADIAVGYATGHVRLINFQTNVRTKSFNPDVMNNLVEWIDFNCNDEYVVVLYDNGHVRTFNVKTGILSEKIKVENSIGVIRYHHSKPHIMGMASRTGSIHIWDSLKKRQIYKDSEAHNAPIRDIAWDAQNPDILYSGGYDCCVKVVDIRKRFCELTLKNQHPVNCFNVSSCGNFITTGNLAGFVTLFDTRHTKRFVSEADLSGGNSNVKIQRIIEVPFNRETTLQSEQSNVSISETQLDTSPANITPNTEIDDLIAEARNNKARVSISGDTVGDLSMGFGQRASIAGRRSSIGMGGKRLSADFGAQNLMRYLDISTESVDSPVKASPTASESFSKRRSLHNISDNAIREQQEPISTTPKSSTIASSRLNTLKKVDESEEVETFGTPPTHLVPEITHQSENKENTPFIPNSMHSSTPNIAAQVSSKQSSTINIASETGIAEKQTPPTLSNTISGADLSQIMNAINGLHARMDKLEANIKEQVMQTQFRLQEEHYERFWGIHNTLLLQAGQIKDRIAEVDEGMNVIGAYLNLACPIPTEHVDLPLSLERIHDVNEEREKQF
ncbi:uncharacterized protein LOC134830106 [Culicoides brevitarsis]|uniref:uncharacterized protein LOC134830106 n=1 Tax=Culicoides brevitarsis TaxID=469753 RepID=UPI00307B49FA